MSEIYHLKSFFKKNLNLSSLYINNHWNEVSKQLQADTKKIEDNIEKVSHFNELSHIAIEDVRDIYDQYQTHLDLHGTVKSMESRKLRQLLRILFPNLKGGVTKGLYEDQNQFEDFVNTLIERNKQSLLKNLILELFYQYPKDKKGLLFKRLHKIYCHLDRNRKSNQLFIKANKQFQLINKEAPLKIAQEIMNTNKDLDSILKNLWIKERHLSYGIGQEIVEEICYFVQSQNLIEDDKSLNRFLNYFSGPEKAELKTCTFRYEDIQPIVRTLLGPFRYKKPDKVHKKKITEFLDQHVGDPRHKSEKWISMPREKEIFLKWKIDETIKDFLELLSYTARENVDVDRMWYYRKEFIECYWKENHISDAWIVLGRKDYENRDKFLKEGLHEYGQLILGGAPHHSALIFQIGDLIISEWNYNGKARIWKESSRHAPKFHKREYSRDDLALYADEEFIHHYRYDKEYIWQRKMSDYIEAYTDIKCPEILSEKFW